ncbi:U3 small nucleolar RNA-associated protein 18-like [Gracilariopsis chorda]|uniref:U3 small nucleolar RNA-associated protein 18-like n=1 Tax=Gracilariopsis chorda TaxID=448386 RepID=A0A2V3IXV7_9FLOR|nr:U3 small nucleolar RNA-associated protein 18-like [Gracilariopsis chorda]|eukprot:PXF46939.1 U3 small nucleolar RNA-associated protein 18-like [Gracilariopsis chorda]
MSGQDTLFYVDREPDEFDEEERRVKSREAVYNQTLTETKPADVVKKAVAKPVWVDEDDESLSVDLLKVPRRKKLRKSLGEKHVSATEYAKRIREYYANESETKGGASKGWAQLPSQKKKQHDESGDESSLDEEDMSDTERGLSENMNSLLQSTASLLAKRKRARRNDGNGDGAPVLPTKVLKLRVLNNANHEDPCQAEARCVEFHPSGRVLLTAGLDKTLRLFQVQGRDCTRVQSVHVKNFPIHRAKFSGGGKEVILTGRRRHFYQVDLESGSVTPIHTLQQHDERSWEQMEVSADGRKLAFVGAQGKVIIMDNKSKRETGQLRHNGRVACLAFAPAGSSREHCVYTATVEGTVHLWDVRKMSCIDAHKDEGAIHSTSIAVSGTHYALGSDSGILNVYGAEAIGGTKNGGRGIYGLRTEQPLKSFENLTTDVEHVTFNSDGQLIAFASHVKKNAVRIAHVPSMSVYSNWPTIRSNVRRVCSLAFSPGSGYLAVGNDGGEVQLLRLQAYPAS